MGAQLDNGEWHEVEQSPPDTSPGDEIDEILEDFGYSVVNNPGSSRAKLKRQAIARLNRLMLLEVKRQQVKWIERYLLAWSGDLPFEAKDSMRFQLAELKAAIDAQLNKEEK